MGAAENSQEATTSSAAVDALDHIFLSLLQDFCKMVISHANHSAEFILQLSGNFLNESVQHALVDFHQLYFSAQNEFTDTSKQVNADVDNMIDNIQAILDKGTEIDQTKVAEVESIRSNRLSLAGLQKKLEKLITIDASIKDTLLPVLSGMQFEDMLQHRLSHIITAWEATVTTKHSDDRKTNTDIISQRIAGILTSQLERKLYYSLVLKAPPPEGIEDLGLMEVLFEDSHPNKG